MTTHKDRPTYRRRRLLELSAALTLLVSVAGPAAADDLAQVADPAAIGFSATGLARIAPSYQARFDSFQKDIVPGAVVAVAKGGKLAYLQPIGFQDRARTVPMKPDSIFWIASMTKPVTSVAAMILVDDGKLELDAPVAKYLPEIANMRVASETATPATMADQLEPQKRPMTVRDLLRHTSGIAYPEMDFAFPADGGADADQKARVEHLHMRYAWLDATTWRRDNTIGNFVSALSLLPLAHQPGEAHEYGWSADVLGRVIEVASGQPLDQFLQSRLFTPLHMVDTGFDVPKDKLDRLVNSPMPQRPRVWDFTKPTKLFSGGGGLVSTAPDYLRFCQMLLNGGELDGVRVLSQQSVTAMTTNALPPDVKIYGGDEVSARAGTTFGLGFAITTNPAGSWIGRSPGSFGWAGHWGTYFWIDPTEKLIGIQMIQATPGSKARASMRAAGIHRLVYGALSPGSE
ncbi:beta-lactamase family protein [Bradyrhizobium jicamae]|uniref:serine hydrolase domain-containing protein n=1 Tax=Bradyrhizobium jicamae TaxID=280332 RepID=UPI001BA521D4|nr:serine hydrolase domain-containing protein [Bradyrhizobium jicamae]MBR0751713.1 beta-lactamase family protein [Bradyrhizobium jicamae]